MEWLTDPAIWLGLATLILLELVLGIDNLVFLAILSDKLPPNERDAARRLGLVFALLLRLALLAGIFWLTTLTRPLFSPFGRDISARDLILLGGGLFLLLKATVEIHDRLESPSRDESDEVAARAGFGAVVAQIVALDAVFSIDSILTAVGMTNHLAIMMLAVVVAMVLMLFASKPLTEFVNARPPLVILCLGFLLMIGLSLVADGAGFYIPKGYLYAAIGFSVLIEILNQVAMRNRQRRLAVIPRRQRVAEAVLRLLGGVPSPAAEDAALEPLLTDSTTTSEFAPSEKQMIKGVLELAERPIGSLMTPREDVAWIDLDNPPGESMTAIRRSPHGQFLVCQGSLDRIAGVVRKQDLLDAGADDPLAKIRAKTQPVAALNESASILNAIELFKRTPVHMAIVIDARGILLGILTQTDLLEAIAGELPDNPAINDSQ